MTPLAPTWTTESRPRARTRVEPVELRTSGGELTAQLFHPRRLHGAVVLAHPNQTGLLSPAERSVAAALAQAGFATLLVGLLTGEDDAARDDVPLQAGRLLDAARWLDAVQGPRLPLGVLGVGASGAAALVAAAVEPRRISALICRASRPDRAGAALLLCPAPTLFLVNGRDARERAANEAACAGSGVRTLKLVPTEPEAGADFVRSSALSLDWFARWLRPWATLRSSC